MNQFINDAKSYSSTLSASGVGNLNYIKPDQALQSSLSTEQSQAQSDANTTTTTLQTFLQNAQSQFKGLLQNEQSSDKSYIQLLAATVRNQIQQ